MIRAVHPPMIVACLALAAGGAGAGESRCWIDKGAVVVAAAYGPIVGDFIFDLSQAHSQLHVTAAQAAGWTGATARRTLRLAGQTLPAFAIAIADLDGHTRDFPTNIAGVLGADVLGRFTLDMDFDPCRLRLSRKPGPGANTGRGLKIRMIRGAPAVFAAISDGVTARAGWFAVDTASAGSRIAHASFSRSLRAGDDPSDRVRPPARLRAVSIDGNLIEQSPAGVMSGSAPGLAGALGLAVWSRFHLSVGGGQKWLDISQRKARVQAIHRAAGTVSKARPS
jgi:hypothetical protein